MQEVDEYQQLQKQLESKKSTPSFKSYPVAECKLCGEQKFMYKCETHGTYFCKPCLRAVEQVSMHKQSFKAVCSRPLNEWPLLDCNYFPCVPTNKEKGGI